jgi:hypothetical protein
MFFVLFELTCTVVMVVDITYWAILYPTSKMQADKHEPGASCCSQFFNFGSITVCFGDVRVYVTDGTCAPGTLSGPRCQLFLFNRRCAAQ